MATATASSAQIINLFNKHVIGNYTRFPVCLVRGEESFVWDAEGRRYLDFFPGWGCGLLGHCPPRIVQAGQEQAAQLIHVPNTWYTEPQGLLGKAVGERGGFDGKCFFCNSGTEAGEAAIKLARLHGTPQDRYKIISGVTSVHARTLGAARGALMARPKFADLLKPGTHAATFGGNPIACRAALATIETIEEDGLLDRAEQIGERFRNHFEVLKKRCPLVQQIRIQGAMI